MLSSATRCHTLLCALFVLVLAIMAPARARAQHETTVPAPRSSQIDTLRFTGTPGEHLIVQLPRHIGHREVQQYEPLRLPALSLLVDRAFFWNTLVDDAGRHELPLRAHYRNAPPATVVLIVELSDHDE